MAGRASVTQVTDSFERVRPRTGRAIGRNHKEWASSQALTLPDLVKARALC
jgi:hypothetical protein